MMKKTAAKQPARGRPRSIDRETVLSAAMKSADAELSLPALAESLGTTVTTIYRLFGDKAGLHTAMYGEALRDIDVIRGSNWAEWLDNYVKVLLDLTRRYPFALTLQFNHRNFTAELRSLAERSLAVLAPGIELLVKAGLDEQSAHNSLAAIKAIVFEYAHTQRVYEESPIDLEPFETLRGPGEQQLMHVLKIFQNGIRAEMRSVKRA